MSLDHVSLSGAASEARAVPVVQRWTRYGHDRAYVKVGDQNLGYRDLKTGAVVCGRDGEPDLVRAATEDLYVRVRERAAAAAYAPKHAQPDAEAPVPPPPTPPAPVVQLLPDRDLARNRPGQAVRQQAIELRDAAPVRTLFARMVGAKTDERAYRIGTDGESEVARQLARLGPHWCVLHSVPVGERDSDIDHVVIGPAGVFTINAKNHPHASVWVGGETVKVNGYSQPYVRNSRHEAQRAARLLSKAAGFDVSVLGIVAIMGAHRGLTVKRQPADGVVTVLARKELAGHLRQLPDELGRPSIERIFHVARHLATWQPRTVAWSEFG